MNRFFFKLALAGTGVALLVSCSDSDINSEATPRPEPTATTAPATPNVPDGTPPLGTPTAAPAAGVTAEEAGELAREHLATWLGPAGSLEATIVLVAEESTWQTACLDLPRPGESCGQALTNGYSVQLQLGSAEYQVRMNAAGTDVRWVPETQAMVSFVEASTNSTVFQTDDGSTIVAQPVRGTDFTVRPEDLAEGAAVAVGLSRAPQRDGWLLVWLDAVGS